MPCCRICQRATQGIGACRVLGQYDVQYFQCVRCGFVQTEAPHWLAEADARRIPVDRPGLWDRNFLLAHKTVAVIRIFSDPHGRFLDYGGGYGILVRLMRQAGLAFYWYDEYAANRYAAGWEGSIDEGARYDLVTAFEVFEHLEEPLRVIRELVRLSSNVLFTTELVPKPTPRPGEWWYYAPEGGQHVSFYTLEALAEIATRLEMRLCTDGQRVHLLTRRAVPSWLFNLVSRGKVARLLNRLGGYRGPCWDDSCHPPGAT
jgi:Methyltransferase domain